VKLGFSFHPKWAKKLTLKIFLARLKQIYISRTPRLLKNWRHWTR